VTLSQYTDAITFQAEAILQNLTSFDVVVYFHCYLCSLVSLITSRFGKQLLVCVVGLAYSRSR